MAWTQSDLDALEARIATARKVAQAGNFSVTDYDIEDLLTLRDRMKEALAGSGSGSSSVRSYRSNLASFYKD